jgi:hypothetical protein
VKKRQAWLSRLICVYLAVIGLVISGARPAWSQGVELVVSIARPSEGETFYTGRTSWVYSTSVIGWVTSNTHDPAQINVQLEILQGRELFGSLTTQPLADGSFSFDVTVNPQGIQEGSLNREEECGICHHHGDASLPQGPTLLRVTATDPAGRQAVAERHIVVDRSDTATVPVRVVLADDPQKAVPNLRVTGSTWLYMWRARSSFAFTDASGQGMVRVEALSEAPTRYLFQVAPAIVDGVLYTGIEPVRVTLPPGATTAQPVTLKVRAQTGQIFGNLKTDAPVRILPLPIWAIRPLNGAAYRVQTSAEGTFSFSDLPIDAYLITADLPALAAQGFSSAIQMVDLSQSLSVSITMELTPSTGSELQGSVQDPQGSALPFAWVKIEKANLVQSVAPGTGAYALLGLQSESHTVLVAAPGFYSQAHVVTPSTHPAADVSFNLVQRPQTQRVPWGSGELIIPPESRASVEGHQITLHHGWIWGKGGDTRPLIIATAEAEITLQDGEFALEYLSGQTPWLYVMDGHALVRWNDKAEPVTVQGGEMLALTHDLRPVPLLTDPTVASALHPVTELPVPLAWEPTLGAQLRDRLAQKGISTAQVVTLGAGVAALSLLVLSSALAVRWNARRHANQRHPV